VVRDGWGDAHRHVRAVPASLNQRDGPAGTADYGSSRGSGRVEPSGPRPSWRICSAIATSTAARTAAGDTSGSTDRAAASDRDDTEMFSTMITSPNFNGGLLQG
jgi:hypothetical protein